MRLTLFCMAKRHFRVICLALGVVAALNAQAQPDAAASAAPAAPSMAAASPASAASTVTARISVPRITARLTAAQLGLVINTADPYSVAVGEHYIQRRGLHPQQVLRLALPLRDALEESEFNALQAAIAQHYGTETQALALAWVQPWAVGCNALTGALMMGYDGALCRRTCAPPSRPSPYFNSATARAQRDLGLRPAMQIAAPSVAQALALIDRGVAADGTLGRRGGLPALALYVTSHDSARNVRAPLFPPPGVAAAVGLEIAQRPVEALGEAERLILMQVGVAKLPPLEGLRWWPGALADHLTSYGGRLTAPNGQSSALEWIAAGATASHGTASEPCNHLQKFPHPALLLAHYTQGATALEAYARSVAWPQQSVFIGEPLAAPFPLAFRRAR